MDRTAFEATFYARQKELRFFAHDEGISRVRKISRMLGISSVETAQTFLRDDRNDLPLRSPLLEGRLAEANLDELNTGLEAAKAEFQRLEDELEKVLRRVRAAEGERQGGRRGPPRARRDVPRAQPALQRAAERRSRPAAGRRPGSGCGEGSGRAGAGWRRKSDASGRRSSVYRRLETELEGLEEDRRRSERREQDRRELFQAQKRVADIESEVWDTLEGLDDEESDEEPVPGWADLFELDGPDLLFGPARCWGMPQKS